MRRLTTALASAALLAFISMPAAVNTSAQTVQEQTAAKPTKSVLKSCPVHPEIKVKSANKCPRCRAVARQKMNARAKSKVDETQQPEVTGANE